MTTISGIRDTVLVVGMVTVLVGHMASDACGMDKCSQLSIRSTTAPCLEKLSIIEDFSTFETSTVLSAAACVSKCHVNSLCDLAVFEGPLQGSCSLMAHSNTGPVSPVPFPLNKTGCVVMTVNSPRCQNCGVPRRYTCECVTLYSGFKCETRYFGHCGSVGWMFMGLNNVRTSQKLEMAVKVVVTNPDESRVCHRVDTVYEGPPLGIYVMLSEPSLSVDHVEEAFTIPATMEFNIFRKTPSMTTVKLLLNGSVYEDPAPLTAVSYKPMFRLPEPYTTYEESSNAGDPVDIVSGLAQGYRLLSRSLATTVFNPNTSSGAMVFMTKASRMANHSQTDFILPLELTATSYTMHSGQRAQRTYAFGDGYHDEDVTDTGKRWDLDTCWYPVPSVVATQTIGILREEVLRGKEVRVLMESGDVISADTLHVTLTPNDVVVELAPTVTQVDNSGPFTFERVAISVRKTIAHCNRVLGKSQIVRHDHSLFTGKLTWITSRNSWAEMYKVDANGQGQGGLGYLLLKVLRGSESRVCVEFSDLETLCISDGKLIIKENPPQSILFQTRAFIKPSFASDVSFQGFMDPECQSTEYLVSTDGWIKAVSYVIGNPEVTVQHNVTFNIITWFLKDHT